MSSLKISEKMRQFMVNQLTYDLRNPSGDWRDYQDAVDRWNYLDSLVKSRSLQILKAEDLPPFPDVDDYPLID
tara:strand:+ start:211 stop:429 length:219 start_codon:yes stop_codon:yes gene_type:complete